MHVKNIYILRKKSVKTQVYKGMTVCALQTQRKPTCRPGGCTLTLHTGIALSDDRVPTPPARASFAKLRLLTDM